MVGPEALSSRDTQSLGKVPPHSLEAEEALLGSALLSRDAVSRLMEEVRPADFYSPSNQTVYEAMKGLFDTGKPIDTVTVSELIFKDSKNSKSINASYIARLVDNVPSSANFERYIEIVLEHSHRRKLLKASGRIELLAMAMDKEIHSVLDEAEQTIFTASDDAIGDGLVGVNDVLEGAIERIEEIENRGTGLSGLPTYFSDLDYYLSGLQEGNLIVLASRDAPVITVTDIRAKSRRLKSSKGLDLIVVDYLQLMQSSSGDNRQQEIAEISRNLKNLARELRVPILALSQLNRAAEAREDKRPRLGDLRESGAIEQDADIVMMLYRDDYYNPGTEIPGVAEVNIVKNRSGQTGKVELFFSKEFTQFSNYSKQEQQ